MGESARERLGEWIRPDGGVVLLTVECQRGVVGAESALPELAAVARSSGALRNVARLVAAAHEADVQVIHAVAERRPDGRGANTNARLFRAAARLPVQQHSGSTAVRIAEPIEVADEDIVVRRLHGLSPLAGTDVDALLRNLGCRTLIVTGVSANVAVPNAVFDAVNGGYTVVVPADAIAGVPADYTPAMIRNTLALVATITTTDEVLGCWKAPRRAGRADGASRSADRVAGRGAGRGAAGGAVSRG
ncbi:Isochorismatase [Streptomyces venezuelae]|uniref:cysteine hydrolase n=1 Tax=Streptomyces gardneri TaxID=66892 RepID=UPI0006BCAD73|nr:cysteine hydrolase [Streptomyces gardneri]ALO06944.1 Isochorismatase [Streptomyces venezuelae]WRK35608.1 cysteine hydrolase [Streptomyces venezuelae]CUM42758.1 Isochorismatase [Streptomyces venezuelae]